MCDGRHPNCARDGRANLALPLGTAGTDTECTLSHSTAVSNCPKTGVMATVSALNVVISFRFHRILTQFELVMGYNPKRVRALFDPKDHPEHDETPFLDDKPKKIIQKK